ncbi:MAG: hypothetical protein HQL32_09525 [Planctomycetes bacterium]|nr:hypothetical protein [Planctomycetota bacterium]
MHTNGINMDANQLRSNVDSLLCISYAGPLGNYSLFYFVIMKITYILISILSLCHYNLSAEERIHDGIVKISAKDISLVRKMISETLTPSLASISDWGAKAIKDKEESEKFTSQFVGPKFVLQDSLRVLKSVEFYLRKFSTLKYENKEKWRNDLKIICAAQYYMTELYSLFQDNKLPLKGELRELLLNTTKGCNKVLLGVSEILIAAPIEQ